MLRRPPISTLTHSFPTRRSSDLRQGGPQACLQEPSKAGRPARQRTSSDLERSTGAERDREVSWSEPPHLRSERSEEHTSELQSLMRISYAVFCLKKKIETNKKLTTELKNKANYHRMYHKEN